MWQAEAVGEAEKVADELKLHVADRRQLVGVHVRDERL